MKRGLAAANNHDIKFRIMTHHHPPLRLLRIAYVGSDFTAQIINFHNDLSVLFDETAALLL